MFSEYFRLNDNPFGETPDPRFFYQVPSQIAALEQLSWALDRNKGLCLLTGEVGTGKTMLSRLLMKVQDQTSRTALILHPALSQTDLLSSITDEFGLDTSACKTPKDKLDVLNDFLVEGALKQQRSLLVIDEAQTLSFEILEAIRLLTNLESDSQKLLQIVLVAQPELLAKLRHPHLRQLRQRISVKPQLEPLTESQVKKYILHRLEVAGGRNYLRFEDKAIRLLHQKSGGVPRVINFCCELVLSKAEQTRIRVIDQRFVSAAINPGGGLKRRISSFLSP